MITEFGGAVAVPSAVRSNDSTTTIRVNDVIMIRMDGAIDNTVNSAISWIARSVTPPLPWPRLILMSCANAGSARDPAAISVAKNKTLRGNGADLTKASLDGPARRPFRLRDFRIRSWTRAEPAERPVARYAGAPDLAATLARPTAPRRAARSARRPVCEVQPPGAAPSRRDSGLRTISRAPEAGARRVPARAMAAPSVLHSSVPG